jgi:hypothetical protein
MPDLEYVAFVGDAMWPATAPTRGRHLPGTGRLEQIANHLANYKDGAIDGLVLSTVVGVVQV